MQSYRVEPALWEAREIEVPLENLEPMATRVGLVWMVWTVSREQRGRRDPWEHQDLE